MDYTINDTLEYLGKEMAEFDIRLSQQLERIKAGFEWNSCGVNNKLNRALKENYKTYQDLAYDIVKEGKINEYLGYCKSELNEAIAYIGAKQQGLKAVGKDDSMKYENKEYNYCFTLYESICSDIRELEALIEKNNIEMER